MMNAKEKNKIFLVIGQIRECHDHLINNGCEIVWLIPKKKFLKSDIKRSTVATVLFNDESNRDYVIKLIKQLYNIYKFEHVIAFHDDYQDIAILASEELNLKDPLGHNLSIVESFRCKKTMRKILDFEKLSQIKWAEVNSLNDIKIFFDKYKFINKAIMKPANGSGSRSIKLINRKDLSLDVLTMSNLNNRIIEEYIDGEEYSVETISYNRQHQIISITKKFTENFIEKGHLVPAKIDEEIFKKVKKVIHKFLSIMKFKNGITHTEIKINNEKVYIIESHTRVGGDKIPNLIKYSFDIDLYEYYAQLFLNSDYSYQLYKKFSDISKKYNKVKQTCIWYTSPKIKKRSKVNKIQGLNEIERCPGFLEYKVIKGAGDNVDPLQSSYDRALYVIFRSNNSSDVINQAQDASKKITWF